MEILRQVLNERIQLSEESWQMLTKICHKELYKKNDFVLQIGQICKGLYFVNSGLLRLFYLKEEKEISEWFAFEHSFCYSIISYFQKVPSYLAVQCLEDSEVITISHDGLMELKNKNFEISNLAFTLISNSLIYSQKRMLSIQFETALQRYENLINAHPITVQRIPLHYIASYLGITSETLSRIRTQIH